MSSSMKLIFSALFCALNVFFVSGNDVGENYINRYSPIAVSEMQRTGIPASIKLAQGLLESDKGRSKLASTANNHFGIKCGKGWKGGKYYQQDDDYNKRGRLVNSCFRSFDSAVESYIAHSEFLLDTNKSERYGFLFELDTKDYKNWAKGLKDAGYATDPNYPAKLTQIIKHYGLDKYDIHMGTQNMHRNFARKNRPEASDYTLKFKEKKEIALTGRMVRFKTVNGVRAIESKGNETLEELAERTGLFESTILEFNEFLHLSYQAIPNGTNIFLAQKKRSNKEGKGWHKVRDGESMELLSQKYGVRLSTLYSINKMSKDEMPLPGQKISLFSKVKKSQRPKTKKKPVNENGEFLF